MHRTPDDIDDELLVLRCQDGEREALEKLVARWRPRPLRHAWMQMDKHVGLHQAIAVPTC